MKKLKVLGVSAGAGILLFPFRKNLIANVETRGVFYTKGLEQWKLNFGDTPYYKDGTLPDCKPDIILSSPDCGSASIMRLSKVKELGNPQENKSLNLVIESILHYKPKIFLIENLPRLLSLLPKNFFEETFKDYKLIFHERSVFDYGNSQESRKRLLIIGVHKKTGKKYLNAFDEVFQVKTPTTTRNLLKPLTFSQENNTNQIPFMSKTLAMYDYRKLPEKKNLTVAKIHRLWVRDFKDEKKWPIKTAKMSTLPGDDGVRQFRFFRFFRFRRDRFFNLDRVLQILDGFGQFLDALLEVGNVLHLVFQSAEAGIIVPAQDQCHGDQQDDDGKLNFYHTAASL